MVTAIIITIIVLIALTFFIYYNRFVRLSHQVDNSLAQINVQLKKRSDLVPNLLNSVKGYMKHERKIISEVTEARKALVGARNMEKKMKAGNKLQSALKSIFAIAENYPDLKANQNFMQLQEELSGTENKIAYSRQFYNDNVQEFNREIQQFPTNFVASMFKYKEKEFFKTKGVEREPVKVSF